MKKINFRAPGTYVSLAALLALAAGFGLWLRGAHYGLWGYAAAGLSVLGFAALGLRFVPEWMRFWSREGEDGLAAAPARDAKTAAGVFLVLLLFDVLVLLAVWALRALLGYPSSFSQMLSFWATGLDSRHYLDIARDWYLGEGDIDRLVQLVFLPGYPLAIRLVHLLVPDWTLAALFTSALCFAGGGAVLYRLLRLDLPRETALRAIALLCLMPGAFFFAAPMSESLFFLLCVSCLYLARTRRWLAGCVCGGAAAFTRSLGLTLLAPLVLELVGSAVRRPDGKRALRRAAALLLILVGFGAYCWVNYRVAGDPFQYMIYQREHWGQRLGWFFNTSAYQTENLLRCAGTENAKFWGLWLPNLAASFAFLGVFTAAAKRLRASITAWAIGYFFVAVGVTWLLSAPRYLLTFFPFPTALALLTQKRPRAAAAAAAICAVLAFCYLLAFVQRWQVW